MKAQAPRPYGLLAELTWSCPLHCPYCSNPPVHKNSGKELSTEEWRRVLGEAADLGVMHALFSGGEPMLRPDLEEIVFAAHSCGLYTNLITSGIGLTEGRAEGLRQSGLDSIQISFQADEVELADSIAGSKAHFLKCKAAGAARAAGLPLTLNVVVHRYNIDRIKEIISFAESLHADKLELANVQYYGWAFLNRFALIPAKLQIEEANKLISSQRERLKGRMELVYIYSDYFMDRPKPCMNGWGQRYLTVNPLGEALPCPTSSEIKSLRFDSVRDYSLSWIWLESEAFNRFRGEEWMQEPCITCEFRKVDFGGCRCQAALLTGDAAATDPVCSLSPHHILFTPGADASLEEPVSVSSLNSSLNNFAFRQYPRNLSE